jgi:hypothetical protein
MKARTEQGFHQANWNSSREAKKCWCLHQNLQWIHAPSNLAMIVGPCGTTFDAELTAASGRY